MFFPTINDKLSEKNKHYRINYTTYESYKNIADENVYEHYECINKIVRKRRATIC